VIGGWRITSKKQAIATKFDWHGIGGPTVWFSVGGMGDDRIPIVVTNNQMRAIAMGQRKAKLEITATMVEYNAPAHLPGEIKKEAKNEN
jgi:hypothetical protein